MKISSETISKVHKLYREWEQSSKNVSFARFVSFQLEWSDNHGSFHDLPVDGSEDFTWACVEMERRKC